MHGYSRASEVEWFLKGSSNANLKMTNSDQDLKLLRRVGLAGVGIIGSLAIISFVNRSSEYGSQFSRPSIAVPLLLMAGTALAFLALKYALNIENPRKPLLLLIVCIGIALQAFRRTLTHLLES